MLVFDVETLGAESNSVILSAAIVYMNPAEKNTWESLYENTLFVKFNVKEQVKQYNRVTEKDTITWWNKQCDLAKKQSFFPSEKDLPAKEAIACIRNYIAENCDPKTTLIWTRGSLDQMVIDSLCKATGDEPIMQYSNYRDMRTYVDLAATNSTRGYCAINPETYPGTWDRNVVVKHNPIDDIVLDALMLLYPS
jgi:hypothetical protein